MRQPHPERGGTAALLFGWVLFTSISSLAGARFIAASHDALTPASLSEAAACLAFAFSRRRRQQPAALSSSTGLGATAAQQAAYRAWLLGLGLVRLLASVLTFASFALSSVAQTYIVRTLEPLCSYAIIAFVFQRRASGLELGLLAAVAGGIGLVTLAGPGSSSSAGSASAGPVAAAGAVLLGLPHASLAPTALALVATLAVSCRSVASKVVAASSGVPEFDSYLESAQTGLVASLGLQAALWLLFGVPPLQGLQPDARGVWRPEMGALAVCSLFHFAYISASFKVLQRVSPVMHGLFNVLKRVAVIVMAALVAGQPLTPAQVAGVVLANAAAAAFSLRGRLRASLGGLPRQEPRAGAYVAMPVGSWDGEPGAGEGLEGGQGGQAPSDKQREKQQAALGKQGHSGSGSSSLAAGAPALLRLAYVTVGVLAAGAVFLAYVLACLQGGAVHAGLGGAAAPGHRSLVEAAAAGGAGNGGPQRLELLAASLAAEAGAAPSSAAAGAAAAAEAEPVLTTGPPGLLPYNAADTQRQRCLWAIQDATKAALAPFFKAAPGGVALYDVSLHKNLGDAVLWAAAARLVPDFHRAVKYVCAQSQFPGAGASKVEARRSFPHCNVTEMAAAVGRGGLVLAAPGGNWGDLWWFVHGQRLAYLTEMGQLLRGSRGAGDFKVLQLPQSIHFDRPGNRSADAAAVNGLPRGMLSLMLRTVDSLQYAREHYPRTEALVVPDMAFSLGPLQGARPEVDVLLLMRMDKEAAPGELDFVPASQRGDGTSSSDGGGEASLRLWTEQALGAEQLSYTIREWQYGHENYTREVSQVALTQLAESRLRGAVEVISLGRVVVTNRLHAAIVANLIGRPLVWIDTRQKKLSSTRSAAFASSPACSEAHMHSHQAADFKDAVRTAISWLRAPGGFAFELQ